MTEILFIFVTLYAAYVIHQNTRGDKDKQADNSPLIKPIPTDVVVEAKPKVTEKVVTKSKSVKPKPKSTEKTVAKKKTVVKKETVAQKTINMPTGSLRDPKTGDEVKIASSYRMLRRWVKDALVTEGLVDKVYKTNELNATTQRKINKGLNALKKMDKYQ